MQQKILQAFLYNHKLQFSEIEKIIGTRSNKLAYHLKKLKKQNILIKKGETYHLSETAETLIPYLTKKQSILPVILIAIEKKRKIFLCERRKRPYKGKLSLPGGRILVNESIPQSTKRIMKEKFNIDCKFKKINSISHEQITKNKEVIHSFLLVFVTATTKQDIPYSPISKNKSKIIPSDFKLIKNDLTKQTKIKKINSYL